VFVASEQGSMPGEVGYCLLGSQNVRRIEYVEDQGYEDVGDVERKCKSDVWRIV
jgi:hypothetical protein